jgi:tetratricopeptide (TPR) repeat protein
MPAQRLRRVAWVIELTPEIEQAIAIGYERRDRNDMAPTIAYFEDLLARHPDHPVLTYEVAGAYDSAGEEAKAKSLYERALELGIDGEPRRRCLCQYGSTLRWLGELDASLAVLERAWAEFPGSESVRVFQALTLNELGRADEAVGLLLGIVAQHGEVTDLGRYAVGLGGLAQWLLDGRPEGPA